MNVALSPRVQRVKPSPILAVAARAAKLIREGKAIIVLAAGESDFDTPRHIAEAGIAAIRSGFTRYTAVDGIDELKDAIISKFKRDNDIEYRREQILICNGAKQTIYNLCSSILAPHDEAIIPSPYWVTYPDMVLLADGTPVIIPTSEAQGFKITASQLEAAITPRTRLFLLNSPCNPTGAVYTRSELIALGQVLIKHPQIVIGTDDIYEHIYWGQEPLCSLLTAVPELYERTITINGCSKAYAMTGWRIGYCGGPREIITAMATIQEHATSNAGSMNQKAAVAALSGDQSCVSVMNKHFKERHDFIVEGLNTLPGVQCLPTAGTFYAFANVEGAMAALGHADDERFAEYLLNSAGVAVVPGTGFGSPGHMRLSFACGMKTLQDALQRMRGCLDGNIG